MSIISLIAMKATVDRIDSLLSHTFHADLSDDARKQLRCSEKNSVVEITSAQHLKDIRDDLWSAWFELKEAE